MQIFYAPGITGKIWVLDEKESMHCVRVLRMKEGSPVKVIDGKGNLFSGVISKADPKACEIKINEVTENFEKRNYHLHIAISPLKNTERFEWFVEKCVEIGVDEITPIICKNTEKQRIKPERINKIIISAMKQSLKAGLTILNHSVPFEEFIGRDNDAVRMIAHCSASYEKAKVDKVYKKGENALFFIGPEGDFSEDEINMALAAGLSPVHLDRAG
jgi:16S rRNA (uracil1498-N3)-methyltransferase